MPEKRDRIEVTFNTEKESDLEMLNFIDKNGSTRAGFIKTIIRQYMNNMQSLGTDNVSSEETKEMSVTKPNKKQIPKLGASFSSKDFEN